MLCDFFPEPVLLPLGGSTRLVSQYRLRDLAAFERQALDPARPGRDLAAALAEPDEGLRHARLAALYDRARSAGGGFGCPEVSAWLCSPEGLAVSLWASLRHAEPGLAMGEVLGLVVAPEEWAAFERVAWNADPVDEVVRAVDREIGVAYRPGDSGPADWRVSVGRVIKATGYTPETLGDLTLSQWDALCDGLGREPGKARRHAHDLPEPSRGWPEPRIAAEVLRPRMAWYKAARRKASPRPA